uniref:SDR family oxidoreductase n=1 Tax=Anas platyrhynchos platyrhynchos TaxID=8840 RepID=A0A493TQD0_ANAPP
QALDTYGAIDILVSNAAVNPVLGGTLEAEEEVWDKLWEDEERRQAVMSSMGIDRLGTPSDVASVVTFLCSPAASYVVGETVVVAGGAPSRL